MITLLNIQFQMVKIFYQKLRANGENSAKTNMVPCKSVIYKIKIFYILNRFRSKKSILMEL